MTLKPKLGLSLSGGGYRAAAFHLGTLDALHKLGLLDKIDIISTISGGSITGAYYCLHKDNYPQFRAQLYPKLTEKDVIKKVLWSPTFYGLALFVLVFLVSSAYLLFTDYAWISPFLLILMVVLLLKYQFQLFPVSKRIEAIYDEFFYNKATLSSLPDRPKLVIGSTNLNTARPFIFSKSWMQDSTYQFMNPSIKFKAANFPLARAVMASTCVPFAFTPVLMDAEFFENPERDMPRAKPVLVDGGVYDNQGIHRLTQQSADECRFVITSDAGGGGATMLSFNNTISLLLTTVNVFMARIKNVQMVTDVYDNAALAKREIAYLSLGWDLDQCIARFVTNLRKKLILPEVIKAHNIPEEWVKQPLKHARDIQQLLIKNTGYDAIPKPSDQEVSIARKVGTNLTALSKLQVDSLIKQAAALTELQVKLYTPSILQ